MSSLISFINGLHFSIYRSFVSFGRSIAKYFILFMEPPWAGSVVWWWETCQQPEEGIEGSTGAIQGSRSGRPSQGLRSLEGGEDSPKDLGGSSGWSQVVVGSMGILG